MWAVRAGPSRDENSSGDRHEVVVVVGDGEGARAPGQAEAASKEWGGG